QFLAQYQPTLDQHHRRVSGSDLMALARSIVKQGVFNRYAFSYWRLFIEAATRYRQSFGSAIRLAIMGYHFQKLTRLTLSAKAALRVVPQMAPSENAAQ